MSLVTVIGDYNVLYDANSQRNYFMNKSTNATQWETPAEIASEYESFIAKSAAPAAEAVPPPPVAEPGVLFRNDSWVARWDDNNKKAYYISSATSQSQWECPPELQETMNKILQERNSPQQSTTESTTQLTETQEKSNTMDAKTTLSPATRKKRNTIVQPSYIKLAKDRRDLVFSKSETISRKVIGTFGKTWTEEEVEVSNFEIICTDTKTDKVKLKINLKQGHVKAMDDYKNHNHLFEVSDYEMKNVALFETSSNNERDEWIDTCVKNGCRRGDIIIKEGETMWNNEKKPVYILLFADKIEVYQNNKKAKRLYIVNLSKEMDIYCDKSTIIISSKKSKKSDNFVMENELEVEKWMKEMFFITRSWMYNLFDGFLTNGVDRSRFVVPRIVYECCTYLQKNCLEEVGLFRVPGSNAIIQDLKQKYSNDVDDIKLSDVHSVAGVLKLYFRSLSDSLIPSSMYQSLIRLNINVKKDQEAKMVHLKRSIKLLPDPNRLCLNLLIRLLVKVSENESINSMGPKNCAMVFAPGLFKKNATYRSKFKKSDSVFDLTTDVSSMAEDISQCEGVLQVMIENYNTLFEEIEPLY